MKTFKEFWKTNVQGIDISEDEALMAEEMGIGDYVDYDDDSPPDAPSKKKPTKKPIKKSFRVQEGTRVMGVYDSLEEAKGAYQSFFEVDNRRESNGSYSRANYKIVDSSTGRDVTFKSINKSIIPEIAEETSRLIWQGNKDWDEAESIILNKYKGKYKDSDLKESIEAGIGDNIPF